MLTFTLPAERHEADVRSFYREIAQAGNTCIGYGSAGDFAVWLAEMRNRHTGTDLPDGYVREDFYLCCEGDLLVGVFSLKFELTDFLLHYGGHIGYAVRPSQRGRGLASQMLRQGLALARASGLSRVLCVCDEDNPASEAVILKNGGILENRLYDPDERVYVKRFWIDL